MQVTYTFTFDTAEVERFVLDFDAQTMEAVWPITDEQPSWTHLAFHKCTHCPLVEDQHSQCPLAERISDVVARFSRWFSYDQVNVEVVQEDRIVSVRTSAQQGVSSMLGLIIPCSGCPHTAFLRPMAHFHLPFSSQKETAYRAASMYLLAQHFKQQKGLTADASLKGLNELYRNIETVNFHVAKRLREATEKDSSVNAVILLDLLAKTFPMYMNGFMDEVEGLFHSYFHQ